MPRFTANLSMMFNEHPLLQRPAAAATAGFTGIEIQFPYEVPAVDFGAACRDAGVAVAMFNIPTGDFTTGGPGLAAMPGREIEFRDAVSHAMPYVDALKPRTINVIAGRPPTDADPAACLDVLAANMNHAASRFAELGVCVTLEAINPRDVPGYPVTTTRDALAVLDRADHPNLALQYDAYHMQITEGDLITTMTTHIKRIGHIQFADNPGRHEPGTGEINYENVFAAIDDIGYPGWVGAEYRPTRETTATLRWMHP